MAAGFAIAHYEDVPAGRNVRYSQHERGVRAMGMRDYLRTG